MAPGVGLLAGALLVAELAARLDDGLVTRRVEESAGCGEPVGEEVLEEELASVFRPASLGEDRPQSVLPLEAVLSDAWQ